ncbi:uncharacterized protein LOC62_01G001595 [Vanrija pseudolonga]|uniref:Uncharacterized protein n=1 Tax=Vanrija pseudolonga TaxID=143232 RepID=A0AAF1BG23_9TREE|nr:hypothetical protein LOC62_01G001595 [Vanrija pseudolonga]
MDIMTPPAPTIDIRSHGRMSLADLCQLLPARAPAPARRPDPEPARRPRSEVAPPAQSRAPTPLPLSYSTYPHLVVLVVEYTADVRTLLAFRSMCRALNVLVDRVLAQRLATDPAQLVASGKRALLPPYTVVDVVPPRPLRAEHAPLPHRTYRHVSALPPGKGTRAPCRRLAHGFLAGEGMREGSSKCKKINVVFVPTPRGGDTSSPAPAAEGTSTPGPREVVSGFWRQRDSTFFGDVINSLHIVDRLPYASVRLRGVKHLPPGLVSASLGPTATPDEVKAVAGRMIRDRLGQDSNIIRRRANILDGVDVVEVCWASVSFLDDE